MKICITAQGPTLDAPIDPRFGRCANFIFVDSQTMQFETAPNPGAMTGGGAGIQAAQLASEKGSEVVITGHVGPNAFQILSASGIRIFIRAEGTVKNAIEEFQRGNLREVNRATTPAHTGMDRGGGRGGGRGYGRRRQT